MNIAFGILSALIFAISVFTLHTSDRALQGLDGDRKDAYRTVMIRNTMVGCTELLVSAAFLIVACL